MILTEYHKATKAMEVTMFYKSVAATFILMTTLVLPAPAVSSVLEEIIGCKIEVEITCKQPETK